MNLLRLGLKKIILVDYDKVDLHNLNRQFMYTLEDVGHSKVESCKKNAKFHNVGNT
jgi:molybdopterin/thiamine biosynthesis adenylyltransferase